MYSSVTLLLVTLLHLNGRTTAGFVGPSNPGFAGPVINPASNFVASGTGGNFFVSGNTGSTGTGFNFGSNSGQNFGSSNIIVGPTTQAGVIAGGSNLIGGSSGQDSFSQGSNFNQGQGSNFNQGQGSNFNQGQGSNFNQGQGSNFNQGQGSNFNQGQGSNFNQGQGSGSFFVNQGLTGTSSGQSSVSGAGIQIISLGQSGQGTSGSIQSSGSSSGFNSNQGSSSQSSGRVIGGSSGQFSGSSFGFNQNQGSRAQSSGSVIGGPDSFVTGSGFVNQGQGNFISTSGQGSGSSIRFVNQGFGSQSFGSSNQGGFAQILAPETITVTDTTTIDSFVTVTETILNSVPVTITGFAYDTVTVTTRGLHQTQVDDIMALTTTVVERPVTEFVTTAKSNFVYVTEVSVDIFTITHSAHLISQTTFTTVVVQTLTLSSPIVLTSLSTSVAVSTEYRTVVNTVFSHGYN